MIKRITAILFILLANIILLAHAVIPHLHNNGLPSLVKLHSIHSHNLQYDAHDHNAKDHEPDTDIDASCILKQSYPPSNSSFRLECQCNDCTVDYHSNLAIINNINRFNLSIPPKLKNSSPPILDSFYSVHVSICSGLRAPPFA